MIKFLDGRVILYSGDCLGVLAEMPENSVDAVCCDPPYHLTSIVERFGKSGSAPPKDYGDGNGLAAYARAAKGFMGQVWDGGDIAFQVDTWKAVLRVLKPGGYILAFASTRGFWRMCVAIEDAGFITHPMIAWVFGSGFPKATRVKAEGYDGWRYGGQALKPAIEPIYMGQKPFSEKTGTANVLKHGTGAVNIDACRVGDGGGTARSGQAEYPKKADGTEDRSGSWARTGHSVVELNAGRWPANLILSYPEDEYQLSPSATAEQKKELWGWLYENA